MDTVSIVMVPLLYEGETIGVVKRASAHAAARAHEEMRRGVASLAGIAAVAPLIGLFGNRYWNRRVVTELWLFGIYHPVGYYAKAVGIPHTDRPGSTCRDSLLLVLQIP
jgi:hypothetical protein